MSDPALNNQNQSYVDSYVPPTSSQGDSQSSAQVTSSNQPDDALKKLEELVAEFETKKDQQKSQQLSDVESLQQVADKKSPKVDSSVSQSDPLVELEKALEEYEQKYKQRVAETGQDQPVATENKAKGKVSLESFEKALAAEEAKMKAQKPDLQSSPTSENNIQEIPDGESIEEQNIFELLGVSDATDQEKESFLDELQQALWDDFLDKDLALLVSESELAEIEKVKNDSSLSDDKRQAALIEKIEKFVPDIEEVMLEKALALKEDMIWERLDGIRQSFKQNNQDETKLNEAEEHFKQHRWKTGTQILNSL